MAKKKDVDRSMHSLEDELRSGREEVQGDKGRADNDRTGELEEEENPEDVALVPMTRETVSLTKKIFRVIVALLGVALGPALVFLIFSIVNTLNPQAVFLSDSIMLIIYTVSALICGGIFYFIAPAIIRGFLSMVRSMETGLSRMPMEEILWCSIGLVIGLVVALLLSYMVSMFPLPQTISGIISLALYFSLGILGWSIPRKRVGEIRDLRESGGKRSRKGKSAPGNARPKVLDTSVIIDGRILDICQTGFIEGQLVIPGFVLQELRHVSDSADNLKRTRGRRGLDILQKIQNELEIPVMVSEVDYEDIAEVDAKLVKLAQDMDGTVITNDFNLNKVATVQGVPVLNINDLANAIKPVVLPGEEMTVSIVKPGKEFAQGVAYLDDGTMIVVDGGRNHIDETLEVTVTSVLQTSAGRMIFAKIK